MTQEKTLFGNLAAVQVEIPTIQLVKVGATIIAAGLFLILAYSIIKKL